MNDTNSGGTSLSLMEQEDAIASRIDKALTSGLAFSAEAGGLQFRDAAQVLEFAKMMAVSNIGVRAHLRGNPGACLAVCVQAVEWGMSPYAVANKSYSVNDQISYESQLINAVILRRAPIQGRLKIEYSGEADLRRCKVSARLRADEGGEWVEYESPIFSKIHPKNSPLWKSDPDQQQFYYSSRALARRHFPDVILGVYAEDELPGGRSTEHFERVGPDAARRITSTTLVDKMTALAGDDLPPHDKETGEILPDKTKPATEPAKRTRGKREPAAGDVEASGAPSAAAGDKGAAPSDNSPASAGVGSTEGAAPDAALADVHNDARQPPAQAGEAQAGAAQPQADGPAKYPTLDERIASARKHAVAMANDGKGRNSIPKEYGEKKVPAAGREDEHAAWLDAYADEIDRLQAKMP